MIEVLAGGPLTTVQDLGRPGLAHLGVGRSGAADPAALRLANRLVGNAEDAAGLEATLGGLTVRFEVPATVAVTGAPCPVRVGDHDGFDYGPMEVAAGDVLALGTPPTGLRSYLAVRGGIDVAAVLGSRSTDLLAGLGPPPLARGTRLGIGSVVAGLPAVDVAPVPPYPQEPVLRLVPGPRDDWFSAQALDALRSQPYEINPDSNRVGLRLSGPGLERAVTRELPSEGLVTGSLQVPTNGQPVLFLADHPVTGGYPVIGVVEPDDLALAAQARPGQRLRFRVGREAAALQ